MKGLLAGLLAFACLAPRAGAEDYARLAEEVVQSVRDHFYDGKRAQAWADAHKDYGAGIDDRRAFAKRTNQLLDELGVSHTHYYLPTDLDYAPLLSIFESSRARHKIEHDSIGAEFIRLPEGTFVRKVFAGSPAESGGLRRGDRILTADHRPFDPYGSIHDRDGKYVQLTVMRSKGAAPADLDIRVRRINPRAEWLQAQKAGSRLVEREGRKIGYAPLWTCGGDEYRRALERTLTADFKQARVLVLDLRGGWGGCGSEFVNVFIPHPSPDSLESGTFAPAWEKPVVALIDGGTRSGKELIAYELRRNRRGVLIGEKTAGAFLAGRPFLLSDQSVLYLAVSDAKAGGVRLEGVGVEPDIPVADELPYAQGKDPQLDRAFEEAAKR